MNSWSMMASSAAEEKKKSRKVSIPNLHQFYGHLEVCQAACHV